MLSRIFNPPADLSERRYLWLAVTVLSAVGILASVAVSLAIQALLAQPNYLRAAASAVLVPLVVAPPLIFWVAKTITGWGPPSGASRSWAGWTP
jgi:hypothetical protein